MHIHARPAHKDTAFSPLSKLNLGTEVAGIFDYANLDAHLQRAPIRGYPPFTEDGDIATYLDWAVAWDRVRATKTGG